MPSLFTKIINREIPAKIELETEDIIVIHDINPKAKHHLLIIPKKEIATVHDFQKEDAALMSDLIFTAQLLADKLGVSQGYKLHFNVGGQGGQEVFHVHLHFLSDL